MQPGPQRIRSRVRSFFDTGNIFRFIVALLLAFAFWAWVEAANDPETSRVISEVPVVAVESPAELEVVGQLPRVEVRLQGPQSEVQALESDEVQAIVDLSNIEEPGSYSLDVEVAVPEGVRVIQVTPDEITVQVDANETREGVGVEIISPTDVPQNYELRGVTAQPETVSIDGPKQMVDRVSSVRIDVTVDGRSGRFTDYAVPTPVDSNGNEVDGVTVDPPQIAVDVDLEVRGQVRKVIPEVIGTDALAPGYELARPPAAVPTDEVIIEGPEEEVAKVFFLTTEPIDISGWDRSQVVNDVEIDTSNLPPGVTVNSSTVHVSVQIRRQSYRREITDVPILPVNTRSGTTVQVSPDEATIVLEGTASVVENVDPSDISVVVDVQSSNSGTYQFQPRVIMPAGVQYHSITPSTVVVTVSQNDSVTSEATGSDQ